MTRLVKFGDRRGARELSDTGLRFPRWMRTLPGWQPHFKAWRRRRYGAEAIRQLGNSAIWQFGRATNCRRRDEKGAGAPEYANRRERCRAAERSVLLVPLVAGVQDGLLQACNGRGGETVVHLGVHDELRPFAAEDVEHGVRDPVAHELQGFSRVRTHVGCGDHIR